VDQPRPTRRMTDMGPRRMDGFARPGAAGGRPVAPGSRPAGQVQRAQGPAPVASRPMAPRPAMAPQPRQPQPMRPQQAMRPQPQMMQHEQPQYEEGQAPVRQKRSKAKRSGWKVVLQFVIGLAVIAAVAAAIVWLYIKYYTQ